MSWANVDFGCIKCWNISDSKWWEFPSDSKPMHIVAAYFRLVVDNDLWVFCSLAFLFAFHFSPQMFYGAQSVLRIFRTSHEHFSIWSKQVQFIFEKLVVLFPCSRTNFIRRFWFVFEQELCIREVQMHSFFAELFVHQCWHREYMSTSTSKFTNSTATIGHIA